MTFDEPENPYKYGTPRYDAWARGFLAAWPFVLQMRATRTDIARLSDRLRADIASLSDRLHEIENCIAARRKLP
jgi:hypothetical protein